MKNKINILLISLVLLMTSLELIAGEFTTNNPERKRSVSEGMTEIFYKKFVKYQELLADSKLVEARAGFESLAGKRVNSFEQANIDQFIGWIDSSEGKYVLAAKRFQKAINTDSLPNQAHFSMMYQISQMYAGADKIQESLNALHAYFKVTDKIKDSAYYFEASLYSQLEKYKEGIASIKKAIDLSDEPKESWYYLLYSFHMHQSEYLQAAKVLETLIKLNPNKKEYWIGLNEIYFQLKKDDKALAVLALADENGLLNEEKDRIKLFKMYSFLGMPYKAGQILEKGLKDGVIESNFKHWEDLGVRWFAAAEMDKALVAYEQASKMSTDGKIDFQRAYIFFDREDYKNAKIALTNAIEKGGLKESKQGTAWLLLGMAESELNNNAAALKALKMALKFDRSRKNASQWIDHINNLAKQKRESALLAKQLAAEKEANKILD